MKEKILKEVENLKLWVDSNKIVAFLSTILIGFIGHIILITNNIATQDSLWLGFCYNKPGDWEVSLGRWGILIVERICNYVLIPSVVTGIGIVLIAISVVLIVDLFELKSKISIILTSFLLVVSPSITITFMYVHTSLAYTFALLFSSISIWFIYKFKYKKIGICIGLLSFIFTMALYQSYIGIFAGICIMHNILKLLKNDTSIKDTFKNIGIGLAVFIVGGICYYLITNLIFNVFNIELSSYHNANQISVLNILKSLKVTIVDAYSGFYKYLFTDELYYNTNYRRELLWGALLILLFITFVIRLIKVKADNKKEKLAKIAISIFLLLVLPIGLNVIDLLVCCESIYVITATQILLLIPFVLALSEGLFELNGMYFLVMCNLCCIGMTFYVATNTSYQAMVYTYNQSIAVTERIITRIESIDGFDNKRTPVIFAGLIDDENFKRLSNIYNYTYGFGANNTTFHGTYTGQAETWYRFLEIYFGENYARVSDLWYENIINSDEFKNMSCYPAEDSIQVLQDAVVVKLKENPPLP